MRDLDVSMSGRADVPDGDARSIGICSTGIRRIPHLASFLLAPVAAVGTMGFRPSVGVGAIAGWGRRDTALRARRLAARSGLPFLALEDGFLRSVGLGVGGAAPLSLVVDDLGIYYDATQPSRLELLIKSLGTVSGREDEARSALGLMRQHRLSKYNHAPEVSLPPVSAPYTSRVLVIDQTAGDVSVSLGGASDASFRAMLQAALDENPHAEVWVKTHPDVLTGKKKGYLPASALGHHHDERVRILAKDVSPIGLLEQVEKVYVVTSQMGFEALMLNKPVICFGLPWYAGWQLTDDRHPRIRELDARRGVARTVEQLFEAAYLHYARYIDPATGAPASIFDVIDWLTRNKIANDVTRGNTYCVGMSLWKRAIVRPFLTSPSSRVHFVDSLAALSHLTFDTDSRVVVWGVKNGADLAAFAGQRNLPVWRMEDGFLRSVGLGSDLFRPVSLVLDRSGIYYDPISGSELEQIIANQCLGPEELARAARFRETYVSAKLSKYNLGRSPLMIDRAGRRVLLVPGQVEDDASIMRGSPLVRTNLDLLRAVRAANPEACILYKAHPDVVAGNRKGEVPPADLAALADQCVNAANIIDCILAADEVHTMTSLAGFEALLHGRAVHCYGGPFYAGWGLTTDHFPLPHRQRSIDIDSLVHAVMLVYPRYVLPGLSGLASAEQVMAFLVEQSANATAGFEAGWLARKRRKAAALVQLLQSEWAARGT